MKTTILNPNTGEKVTHPEWHAYMAARRTQQRQRAERYAKPFTKKLIDELMKCRELSKKPINAKWAKKAHLSSVSTGALNGANQ